MTYKIAHTLLEAPYIGTRDSLLRGWTIGPHFLQTGIPRNYGIVTAALSLGNIMIYNGIESEYINMFIRYNNIYCFENILFIL